MDARLFDVGCCELYELSNVRLLLSGWFVILGI